MPSTRSSRASASPFRPIGITWAQMASGKVLGKRAQGAIATYRLPSLLGGMLAVLGLWWLLGPLVGARTSLIAAALFAVTPIVALQAQLAIPEGPLLLAIVVAQLTLLRLYCAPKPSAGTELALAFWAAQGFGILLNALAVPILSLSTLIALYIFDRQRRLARTPAPALRRAADARHRRAVALGARPLRRHPVQLHELVGALHRAGRRAGHEVEGGAAHLHARRSSSASCRARCCWCRPSKACGRTALAPCRASSSAGSPATSSTWS